MVRQPKQ